MPLRREEVVAAHIRQTSSEIAARSASQWSVAKISVANEVSTDATLSVGESIKLSKREPY